MSSTVILLHNFLSEDFLRVGEAAGKEGRREPAE